MKRFVVIVPLIFTMGMLFGFGQGDKVDTRNDVPQVHKSILNPDNISGSVDKIIIEENTLRFNDNKIKISFILEPDETISSLNLAENIPSETSSSRRPRENSHFEG